MGKQDRWSNRQYPRSLRVNELVREILADALERVDDERLELVTVTHVSVEADLRHARVEFSALLQGEEEAMAALAEHRHVLQGAIARQARLKRTPELTFAVDETIQTGARIEELLAADRRRRADEA